MGKKTSLLLLLAIPLVLLRTAMAEGTQPRLLDFSGQSIALTKVQRDATLIAFWMVSCVPCLEEMPLLDALAKQLSGDAEVAIIGVNIDEDGELQAARKILEQRKLSYPNFRDPKRELVRKWFPKRPQFLPVPTLLLFDRKLRAQYDQGFQPGMTAEEFIKEWQPHIADAKAGRFTVVLEKVSSARKPADPAQLANMIEKIVRSHHPDMSDAEVKKRVDVAVQAAKAGKPFKID